MKEHPILFSSEMVRAILEGRKTQTRRVIKPQVDDAYWDEKMNHASIWNPRKELICFCPYGQPGDRLWVKETFGVYDRIIGGPNWLPNFKGKDGIYHPVVHFAGKENYAWGMYGSPRKRSGRFMPKSVARIWLEIVNIYVERLRQIMPGEAIAEGIERVKLEAYFGWKDYTGNGQLLSPVMSFHSLWDSINAQRGYGWDVNPWVWVIEFKYIALTPASPAGRGAKEGAR